MRVRWLAVGAVGVVGCQTLLTPTPRDPVEVVADAEPDHLTPAADALGRGDRSAAAVHLAAHVRRHPDQLMFRAQLAELLFTLDRAAEAKAEFERFAADAQSAGGPVRKHLVHCHTRLMELAGRADDRFAERFHRGVGLARLAADLGDDEAAEEVVCQALRALTEARGLRPADPRVHLYLADAYDLTGNRRAAEVSRATARDRAGPGSLTAAEAVRLGLP